MLCLVYKWYFEFKHLIIYCPKYYSRKTYNISLGTFDQIFPERQNVRQHLCQINTANQGVDIISYVTDQFREIVTFGSNLLRSGNVIVLPKLQLIAKELIGLPLGFSGKKIFLHIFHSAAFVFDIDIFLSRSCLFYVLMLRSKQMNKII